MIPPQPLSSDLPHSLLSWLPPGGLGDPRLPSAHLLSCKGTALCTRGREGVRDNGALPAGETSSSSAAPCARSFGLAAFWTLASPTVRLSQTLVDFARLEENDLNFFLFLVLFCWFTLCFLLWGYSEWAGPWARHSYLCWHLFNTRNPAAPATKRLK